jgi:endonuclease/exonuclease/phosphatase family metal-dependent hydrolase
MPDSNSLRIATFNINGLPTFWHMKGADEVLVRRRMRHKAICEWLDQSDIDVICVQEVFTYSNLQLLRRGLPSYQYGAYKPFAFGPRGALVIFSRLPLTVTDYASFLPSTGEVNRSQVPKQNIVRSALKGILVAKMDGLPLTIVNTHLLYNGGDLNLAHRYANIHKAQLDLLGLKVKEQMDSYPDDKIIVAGDFNIEAGEQTRKFLKTYQLYDFFAGDDSPSFHNEFLADIKSTSRIDFLLTNDQTSISSARPQRIFTQRVKLTNGQKVYLSDHEGLVASLSI